MKHFLILSLCVPLKCFLLDTVLGCKSALRTYAHFSRVIVSMGTLGAIALMLLERVSASIHGFQGILSQIYQLLWEKIRKLHIWNIINPWKNLSQAPIVWKSWRGPFFACLALSLTNHKKMQSAGKFKNGRNLIRIIRTQVKAQVWPNSFKYHLVTKFWIKR